MIALAKDRSQSQTYASPGVGTPHHLAMALLETASGIELVHVPYKGSAGAVQDLLSGQVGYMFLPVHVAASLYPGRQAEGARRRQPRAPSAAPRRADTR
jgi:tripartite-type tricarboxylate transporter receptor subunit TctC